MILPPFFGLHSKYDEKSLQEAILSYTSADIVSYNKPTKSCLITYNTLDSLFYNPPSSIAGVSYVTVDLLNTTQKTKKSQVSFIGCDLLMYELPPVVPGKIDIVLARDKDRSVILNWTPPFDGKKNIISYDIQYKPTVSTDWTPSNLNVRATSAKISNLTNLVEYHFRIAAVNSIGAGEYAVSNSVVPSGGISEDCKVVSYVGFNTFNISEIPSVACLNSNNNVLIFSGVDITMAGPFSSTSAASFSATSYLINSAPHIGETSHSHISVRRSELYGWSLVDDFTISFWIKPETPSLSTQTILSASSENNNNSWKIIYTNNSLIFSSGTIDSMQSIISVNNLNLSTSEYTYIALSRSKNYLSFYINNKEKAEIVNSSNINIDGNFLIIGAYAPDYRYSSVNAWGIVQEPFKGLIDEVFISRSALYRGDFDNLPNSNFQLTNCDDCATISGPSNLQVSYIDT